MFRDFWWSQIKWEIVNWAIVTGRKKKKQSTIIKIRKRTDKKSIIEEKLSIEEYIDKKLLSKF